METLLIDLKSRLRITWNDEDTDLTKIINRSKSYLSNLTGKAFDFVEDDCVTELLLERCRYVYNNAGDEFEKNYADELKRLILNVALESVIIDG